MKAQIRNFVIKKNLKKNTRNRIFTNLSDARKIGILYIVNNDNTTFTVEGFINKLRGNGKDTEVLGVMEYRMLDQTGNNNSISNIPVISKKESNWLGIPRSEKINSFLSHNYDIIFDFSNGRNFAVQYILSLARAKIIIGQETDHSGAFYDLIIKKSEETNLKDHIEIILHYLNQIKNS